MNPIKTLNVVVTHLKVSISLNHLEQRGRKVKSLTEIKVLVGEREIGKHTIGGHWSEEQARKEIRKNPARFGITLLPEERTIATVRLGDLPVARGEMDGIHETDAILHALKVNSGKWTKMQGYEGAEKLGLLKV